MRRRIARWLADTADGDGQHPGSYVSNIPRRLRVQLKFGRLREVTDIGRLCLDRVDSVFRGLEGPLLSPTRPPSQGGGEMTFRIRSPALQQ